MRIELPWGMHGAQVEVYRNLTQKCLSVKLNGKVVGHCGAVLLTTATFKVSENARLRIVATGKKTVHATISGIIRQYSETELSQAPLGYRLATYNPKKYASFVDAETLQPLRSADLVLVSGKNIYYHGATYAG